MLYSYTQQEWFTPAEVAIHNKSKDCWVILNGKVLNLTSWLERQFKICKCVKTCSCANKNWYCDGDCVEYCACFDRGFLYCDAKRLAIKILAYAGKEISHWFKGDEWIKYFHPITGLQTTYDIHGNGPREPVVPSTKWRPLEHPWWLNENYVVGKATAKTRPIRITNSLTSSTVTLEVCSEETIFQIMLRYKPHNTHYLSYAWRYMGRGLCLGKTLAENGIPDERERFNDVALPENLHIPDLLLCYNDDLTEDPQRADCSCHEFICLTSEATRCQKNSHGIANVDCL